MIYAEPFVRGCDLSSQWREPASDEPLHFQSRFRQKGKVAGARSELENALCLNPDDFKTHGNLHVVLAEQGDGALAEARFRCALRINRDDSLAQSCLKTKAVRKNRN